MKLGRAYDEEDYAKAITLVGLHHEERQREIEHEKMLTRRGAKNIKARKRTLLSLSLRIIKVIERSLMVKDKR
jgi:hypothetical protein